ncbi:hypothetical protein F4825DRAFT_406208 [Nemania diffusa]|nr:hypothetical protein F4825DRAFT_406208 [Nemania diffusa]
MIKAFPYRGAMWAVCNCLKLQKVPCPIAEIDHANALIDGQCGEGYSGRVVSF